MGEKIYLLFLLFLVGHVASLPLSPSLQLPKPDLNEYVPDIKEAEKPQIFARILAANKKYIMDTFEGDIVLTDGRSAVKCEDCLWPKSKNGTVLVPFALGFNYNDGELNQFKSAMEDFETLTCVKFVPRTTEDNYINIVSGVGCRSSVGRIGGAQRVGIDSDSCVSRGLIQHELNHALGFLHEQMRSDRDEHVKIMWENVIPGYERQFSKSESNNLDLPYDYESVMHYDGYAFSTGGPTIVPIPDPNTPIGQRDGLTILDLSKINKLYGCDVSGQIFNEINGSLTSTNYPSAYPNNAKSNWLIRAPSDKVRVSFVAFNVQYSPNCVLDYVRIYDGPTKRYPLLLDRTCGTTLVPPIIASSNQVLVEFSSDSSVTRTGFKALYNTVQCGGTYLAPKGTITSPGYPKHYDQNLNCVFTIASSDGDKISLSFDDFKMLPDTGCLFDTLEIVDGSRVVRQHCDTDRISTIVSKTNFLRITFASSSYVRLQGFKASYKFVPSWK